jgi:hypothetical protein
MPGAEPVKLAEPDGGKDLAALGARSEGPPASQSVDFPIPASPSSTSVAGLSVVRSRKADKERSSSSLPTMFSAALSAEARE